MTYREWSYECVRCGSAQRQWHWSDTAPDPCACGGSLERVVTTRGVAVIDDSLPGGPRMFENLGPTPVYVESKSQLRAECRARGLKPFVRHRGMPGSDKSSQTTKWI
jgi:hypothetical protein